MLYDIATFPRAAFFEQAAFFSENVGKRLFQIPNVIFVCRPACQMHRAATYEAFFFVDPVLFAVILVQQLASVWYNNFFQIHKATINPGMQNTKLKQRHEGNTMCFAFGFFSLSWLFFHNFLGTNHEQIYSWPCHLATCQRSHSGINIFSMRNNIL